MTYADGDALVPDAFDEHTIILLVRPPDARQFSDEELDRLQAEHLPYLRDLQRRGLVVANGPLDAQTDERLRGVSIYSVPSPRLSGWRMRTRWSEPAAGDRRRALVDRPGGSALRLKRPLVAVSPVPWLECASHARSDHRAPIDRTSLADACMSGTSLGRGASDRSAELR